MSDYKFPLMINHLKNYGQLRNTESRRNSLCQRRAHQLLTEHGTVSRETIHAREQHYIK